MLKITKLDAATELRLVLEGCLMEPWTRDLGSHWEQARHNQHMKSAGAEFLARGMRIKYLLKTMECQVDERRSSGGPEEPAEIDRGKDGRNNNAT